MATAVGHLGAASIVSTESRVPFEQLSTHYVLHDVDAVLYKANVGNQPPARLARAELVDALNKYLEFYWSNYI